MNKLKAEVVFAYLKDGREGIKKLLDKYGQTSYLKRHHMYESTVNKTEEMCKEYSELSSM